MRNSYLFKIIAVIIIQTLLLPGLSFAQLSAGETACLSPSLRINEASVKNLMLVFANSVNPHLTPEVKSIPLSKKKNNRPRT